MWFQTLSPAVRVPQKYSHIEFILRREWLLVWSSGISEAHSETQIFTYDCADDFRKSIDNRVFHHVSNDLVCTRQQYKLVRQWPTGTVEVTRVLYLRFAYSSNLGTHGNPESWNRTLVTLFGLSSSISNLDSTCSSLSGSLPTVFSPLFFPDDGVNSEDLIPRHVNGLSEDLIPRHVCVFYCHSKLVWTNLVCHVT